MKLPAPKPTFYSAAEYSAAPWGDRLKMACQAWAIDGYGSPLSIYVLYLLKVVVYVGAWVAWTTFDGPVGDASALLSETAFQKAVVWSLLFESLGLGCGSGPLTGRYVPPVAAAFHFVRPGTIKLPLLPGLPLLGRPRRGWLDTLLFVAFVGASVRVLVAPAISPMLVTPLIVGLALLGLSDKTIFLAARSEHYGALLVCFLFPDWIAGAVAVALAIWVWAAVSKFNRHFPAVVGVMVSNSPVLRWGPLRRAMYRAYPDDLRPSSLAHRMAHMGTAVELTFPVLLVLGDGGPLTALGLALMVVFHVFITSNVPMGVPIEWNVMVVYQAFFLFGVHCGVSPLDIHSPALAALLVVALVVIPVVGNLRPAWVSFLLSMRYYAGNWAWSVWLFRGDSASRLGAIPKLASLPEHQLARFYDAETITTVLSKVPAFRAMHLHGRALQDLLPRAIDDGADLRDYDYVDGEILCGIVLGYNFGDGHLHDHRLLTQVQAICGFAPGDLRHIQVESQPMLRPELHWEIRDAHDGLLAEGAIAVAQLLQRQPWPEPTAGPITPEAPEVRGPEPVTES